MENDKLILDENVNESKDSYTSPLIYRFVSNIFNLISIVLLFASLAIFVHSLYLNFTNPPIEKYRAYSDSFHTQIYRDNPFCLLIILGFLAWIAIAIFFNIVNWVEHGRLAKRKWVIFNNVCGIIVFICWYWLGLLFD